MGLRRQRLQVHARNPRHNVIPRDTSDRLLWAAGEEHRLAIMGDVPHWYLWTMAVMKEDPSAEECHKALMHCVLDVADNDIARFPCYKEATVSIPENRVVIDLPRLLPHPYRWTGLC